MRKCRARVSCFLLLERKKVWLLSSSPLPPPTSIQVSLIRPSLTSFSSSPSSPNRMGFPEFTTPAGLSALENHLVHVSYIEGSVSSSPLLASCVSSPGGCQQLHGMIMSLWSVFPSKGIKTPAKNVEETKLFFPSLLITVLVTLLRRDTLPSKDLIV